MPAANHGSIFNGFPLAGCVPAVIRNVLTSGAIKFWSRGTIDSSPSRTLAVTPAGRPLRVVWQPKNMPAESRRMRSFAMAFMQREHNDTASPVKCF
jgi:hypothetical protein